MILQSVHAAKSLANLAARHQPIQFVRCSSAQQILADIAEKKATLKEMLEKESPKPYDGPERDHVNFPRRERQILPTKIRLGFLPDSWFQFFYKKTGVTGPYLFGAGFVTFMLSKELYVFEEEFSTGLTLFLMAYFAIKKWGQQTRDYATEQVDKRQAIFEDDKTAKMNALKELIENEKTGQWQMSGQKTLLDAKRENVHMQLETEYRKRMMNVYQEVKKRLDFQMDFATTKRKLEQLHMVDWIYSNVIKSITPQQEKEALQKCLEDLKVLSSKAY